MVVTRRCGGRQGVILAPAYAGAPYGSTPGAATLGDAHGGGNVVETLVQYLVALVVVHMVHMVPLMKHMGQHMAIGDITAVHSVGFFVHNQRVFCIVNVQ